MPKPKSKTRRDLAPLDRAAEIIMKLARVAEPMWVGVALTNALLYLRVGPEDYQRVYRSAVNNVSTVLEE